MFLFFLINQFSAVQFIIFNVEGFHRMTKSSKLGGKCGNHLVQSYWKHSELGQVSPQAVLGQGLNICRAGYSTTTSLVNMLQRFVTLTVKIIFLCLGGMPCISICSRFLLSRNWTSLRRVWLCLLYFPPSGIYTHWFVPIELSLLWSEKSQLSQPVLRNICSKT